MRFNIKVLLSIVLMGLFFMSATFWSKCTDVSRQDNNFYREVDGIEQPGIEAKKPPWNHLNALDHMEQDQISYHKIDCLINEESTVGCRREGQEVYVPFTFIAKYFEVYGKLAEYDGYERLEWKHSYARVYTPSGRYEPQGVFMSFEHYNVEVRDRVKCISGMEGVPISTQWGAQGYFYPIQIAQYGLSHYSKYLIEDPSRRTTLVVEDAEDRTINNWSLLDPSCHVDNVYDAKIRSRVIEFQTTDSLSNTGVSLPIAGKKTTAFFLSFDIKFLTNGSITVVLESKGKKPKIYYVHYVCSRNLITRSGSEITYGIGERTKWSSITRDLVTDLQKGLKIDTKKKLGHVDLQRIVSVNFHGHGFVDNVTLSKDAHLAQFYYAANWLVLHQDLRGGWPIMVVRKLANGQLELPPGWYSAMAQGQAMSLLVRAYVRTANKKYLDAALRATQLFDLPSAEGGILARFIDKYNWYEEYPTTPSSFVLNGFIYSLIGLYDLKQVAPPEQTQDAERLYAAGIESLKAMLPFFDTGSGTIYDLRHFTLGVAPNLARWDYHATHINQLLLLSTIEEDPIFEQTAKRWLTYMKGKRAPHN